MKIGCPSVNRRDGAGARRGDGGRRVIVRRGSRVPPYLFRGAGEVGSKPCVGAQRIAMRFCGAVAKCSGKLSTTSVKWMRDACVAQQHTEIAMQGPPGRIEVP